MKRRPRARVVEVVEVEAEDSPPEPVEAPSPKHAVLYTANVLASCLDLLQGLERGEDLVPAAKRAWNGGKTRARAIRRAERRIAKR